MLAPSNVILIVDDDSDIRDILTELLAAEGYDVATASNGLEAVMYVESHGSPGVILLDIMMPMMNGWDFLRIRETRPVLAATPVIVMSANLELINKSEVKNFERIAKPFDTDRLMQLISKWVHPKAP